MFLSLVLATGLMPLIVQFCSITSCLMLYPYSCAVTGKVFVFLDFFL